MENKAINNWQFAIGKKANNKKRLLPKNSNTKLLIAYYPLQIANCKLQIVYCLLLIAFCLLLSCGGKKDKVADDVYYTCSMDPQVMESKPGSCPICKMPLTEVKKGQAQKKNEFELSDQQIQLGNIKTDTLKEHPLGEDLLLTGIVKPNQNTLISINSRVMGRIEKLYFKNTGDIISKGQPLYEIYSEELNIVIKELLLATEKKKTLKSSEVNMDQILQSAKNKLLLYGLTEEQIKKIENDNIQVNTVTVLSKKDGIIYSVDTKEGAYVTEGGSVYQLADYSTIWVDAEIYSDYMNEVKEGMQATITFPALSEKNFAGKISFVNPELSSSSKINLLRIEIPNKSADIRPGMQAYVSLLLKQTHVLSIPVDAVIKDSKGASVWIKIGTNKFKSVMVQTGIEANGYTEIKSGLKKGDDVVVSGAYLLNSEYIFKKGAEPMAGHEGMNM